MKTFLGKIKKSVVDGATVAAEKTGKLTKLGKAKIEILNTKRKISAQITALGDIVYEAVKQNSLDDIVKSSTMEKIVKSLKTLEIELEENEQKIENLKKKPEESKKGTSKETGKSKKND